MNNEYPQLFIRNHPSVNILIKRILIKKSVYMYTFVSFKFSFL